MKTHTFNPIAEVQSRIKSTASVWTLKRRLFGYMLILVCLLIFFLMTALFLSGQFDSIGEETFNALDMQMGVYEKYVSDHFDSIAAAGINLSRNMTSFLESYLDLNQMSFRSLTDDADRIAEVQQIVLEPLLQQLKQEHCSGVYLILDTTVNSSLENADSSRAGMYLQISGYKSTYNPISLLYGNAEIARENEITPHRQWHLEFDTSLLPAYDELKKLSQEDITKSYRFTDLFTIPGTESRIMLLCVPVLGSDGEFYGMCGFELSESYFMSYYAQPTKVDYLTYLFTPGTSEAIHTEAGFSCGESSGYYRSPVGTLSVQDMGNGLYAYYGDDLSYIGLSRNISLSPCNSDYTLSVLMRKSDYDQARSSETVKVLLIWILIGAATVSLCFFFSKRFLIPLLKSIDQIKSNSSLDEITAIPEIDDLFAFLSAKDHQNTENMNMLRQEKRQTITQNEKLKEEYDSILEEKEHIQTEYEKAQMELSRLAYSRKAEIDPDDYVHFLEGVKTLTSMERKVFEMYLSGMTVKDIAKASNIAESTVYYHNKNIYSKLGVNSLKQLLRYATLMQQQEKEGSALLL